VAINIPGLIIDHPPNTGPNFKEGLLECWMNRNLIAYWMWNTFFETMEISLHCKIVKYKKKKSK
jgi:hypothetical protein